MVHGARRAIGRRRRGGKRSRGVALVEFALIASLLFSLLFGTVEFGWAYVQYLDTRHGAREAARLVAVNYNPDDTSDPQAQTWTIVQDACERMDSSHDVRIRVTRTGTSVNDSASVHVRSELDQLTGFFGFLLDDTQLNSTVEIRLEQAAEWEPTASVTASGTRPAPDAEGFLACP